MAPKLTQRNHIHPIFRIVLFFVLIISGGMLFFSIIWVFNKVYSGIGRELAEVSVALISILILTLVVIGLRAGLSMDRFIRQQKVAAWRVYRSSSQVRRFISLLGYEEFPLAGGQPTEENTQLGEEILALIDRPKRPGRRRSHTMDRWIRVVLAWEKRDQVRNPITLPEFLCEEFGEYKDGSPRMSENCFYENRRRVIDELRKDSKSKATTV